VKESSAKQPEADLRRKDLCAIVQFFAGAKTWRLPVLRFAQSILLLLCLWSAASAESRTALVIGNSDYAFGPLVNPANDAKLMAGTLEKTGFKVTTLLNADRQTMQKALLTFSRDIRDKDTVDCSITQATGHRWLGQTT